MNTVLCRPGLLVSCVIPFRRSVSNHLLSPPRPGLVLARSLPRGLPTASSRDHGVIGLPLGEKVGRDNRPNQVRHPTDQQFTSSCSPPPLARTQLLSVTKFKPNFDKDFHLAGLTHLQAHNGWAFGPDNFRTPGFGFNGVFQPCKGCTNGCGTLSGFTILPQPPTQGGAPLAPYASS